MILQHVPGRVKAGPSIRRIAIHLITFEIITVITLLYLIRKINIKIYV